MIVIAALQAAENILRAHLNYIVLILATATLRTNMIQEEFTAVVFKIQIAHLYIIITIVGHVLLHVTSFNC